MSDTIKLVCLSMMISQSQPCDPVCRWEAVMMISQSLPCDRVSLLQPSMMISQFLSC